MAHAYKPELLGSGKSAFEQAQVDMWIQIIRSEVEPLSRSISYMAMGHVKTNQIEYQYVYGLLKEALKIPNNYLKGKTYFVGGALSIVDVYFTLVQ